MVSGTPGEQVGDEVGDLRLTLAQRERELKAALTDVYELRRHVCPHPDWYGKVRQHLSDVAEAAQYLDTSLDGLPAHVAALAALAAAAQPPGEATGAG